MKTETDAFINIRKITEYLGTDAPTKLTQIHTGAVCDTTSFLQVIGKIEVLKKCLNGKVKFRLPNRIGVSCKGSDTEIKDVEKFIQNVSCFGKEEEPY